MGEMIVLSKWSALDHQYQAVGVYDSRDELKSAVGRDLPVGYGQFGGGEWHIEQFDLNALPIPNEDDESRAKGSLQ